MILPQRLDPDTALVVPDLLRSVAGEDEVALEKELGIGNQHIFDFAPGRTWQRTEDEEPPTAADEEETEQWESPVEEDVRAGDADPDDLAEVKATSGKGWKSNSKDVVSSSHEFQGGSGELVLDEMTDEEGMVRSCRLVARCGSCCTSEQPKQG